MCKYETMIYKAHFLGRDVLQSHLKLSYTRAK
jgi:hypothetical protein